MLTEYQQELVTSHDWVVGWVMKKYHLGGKGELYQDLQQVGRIGLCIAAKAFEPERGFHFATYAQYQVRAKMTRYLLVNGKKSRSVAARCFSQIRKVEGREEEEYSSSFLEPADYREQTPFEEAIASDFLRMCFKHLDERSRKVLEYRYICGFTLQETAKLIGLRTRERTRQLEMKALAKIRKLSKNIVDFPEDENATSTEHADDPFPVDDATSDAAEPSDGICSGTGQDGRTVSGECDDQAIDPCRGQ